MDEPISRRDETDRWEINAVGLEEEILCEMCENPMRTDRGCDGMCSYDKGLYKRIIKVLNDRIKPLQPETATVTIGRTRGETTMWYECDACGEPVDVNDNYCRNCGRKLIHD